MNVLVVHGGDINYYPPVRNLILILLKNGHTVTVITRDKFGVSLEPDKNLNYIVLPECNRKNFFLKSIGYMKRTLKMRNIVMKEMKKHDILWTTTDSAVRDLGNLVFRYKHVMQLMELVEDIPLIPINNCALGTNLKKYANAAFQIVVPEYNRAHIQKTWWQLKKTPVVLPNKMEKETVSADNLPESLKCNLEILHRENRKIILYQGVFQKDRKLEIIAEALEKLSSEYAFYIMGRENEYSRHLCQRYDNVTFLSFVKPPYHLLCTEKAHIGVISYFPEKVANCSELNALYCAPNKIFEYASCGLPMIGTDVPGLEIPLKISGIGYTYSPEDSPEHIVKLIRQIEINYTEMSRNCVAYYNSIDLGTIVDSILNASN